MLILLLFLGATFFLAPKVFFSILGLAVLSAIISEIAHRHTNEEPYTGTRTIWMSDGFTYNAYTETFVDGESQGYEDSRV